MHIRLALATIGLTQTD